jgi:sugar/nucleoside kinase (ribokinase family)
MLDVLLPSAYFCDLIFSGLSDIPKLGDEIFCKGLQITPGAGFIPAVGLTRLGLQVDWACDFGNDFFSRYVLEEAARQNLSSHLFRTHAQPLQAVSVAYSLAGDRAFLSYIDRLPPIDLSNLISTNVARYLLLMSLHTGPDLEAAVEAAHQQGTLVFMDGQVANRTSLADPQLVVALQSVDIFTLNEKEALELTGEHKVESALQRLAAMTAMVVIKLGANGALAQSDAKVVHMPGIPVHAVDTTGAGDNFNCGFLFGLLNGYSLEDCLRCGNFCGSRSTTAQGGWQASPTVNDLNAYLKHE